MARNAQHGVAPSGSYGKLCERGKVWKKEPKLIVISIVVNSENKSDFSLIVILYTNNILIKIKLKIQH
jgi:hypothetical protein